MSTMATTSTTLSSSPSFSSSSASAATAGAVTTTTTRTAISYTCPQFTLAQWANERSCLLSQNERDNYEADIRGMHTVVRETEELRMQSLAELQYILMDIENIPNNCDEADRQCYLRALQLCPRLVAEETNPLAFLRSTDFNVQVAAEHLVKNWSIRWKLFGERAFLPLLSQTGDGALTLDDISGLETGVAQLLPVDEKGRPVIYWHRNRIVQTRHRPVSLRCLFYVLHVAAKDVMAQRHGYVLLIDTRDTLYESFDRKMTKLFLDFISHGSPLRMRAKHITFPAIKSVGTLFLPPMLWLMGRNIRMHTLLHEGCPKEVVMDLEEYGLFRSGIPDVLGGTFGPVEFREWLLQCRALDGEEEEEAAAEASQQQHEQPEETGDAP